MSMSVNFFVGDDARARTQHQDDFAVLNLDCDGKQVAIFGPTSFKEAFDSIAELFNRERVNSNVVQIGDHDPEYRRKLDAVSEIVAAPDFGGDAA